MLAVGKGNFRAPAWRYRSSQRLFCSMVAVFNPLSVSEKANDLGCGKLFIPSIGKVQFQGPPRLYITHPLAESGLRVRLGYIYSGAKELNPVVPMDGISNLSWVIN